MKKITANALRPEAESVRYMAVLVALADLMPIPRLVWIHYRGVSNIAICEYPFGLSEAAVTPHTDFLNKTGLALKG
jgi:hypothetical protein